MFNVRDLLTLAAIAGIGPSRLRALVSHFKSPTAVLQASARDLVAVDGFDKKLALNIARQRDGHGNRLGMKFADEQLSKLNKVDGRVITYWDDEYPELLKKIYDPPPFLFVRGSLKPADKFAVALVGTRSPSVYGKLIAEKLTVGLVSVGVTIVSGLARGIDTTVHRAALKSGGRTLAVIGSGIDIIYPPENRRLVDDVIECGAIVSEYSMGTKPDAVNFPRRNRIISGLSLGTVIVETTIQGGAMITANTALDQNREVFAVPGNVTERRAGGPNKLIQQGRAKLIETVEDIVAELEPRLKPLLGQHPAGAKTVEIPLSDAENTIYGLLSEKPLHIDALAERSVLPTSEALVHLLNLEFKDLVKQLPGKVFARL
ncbi:MAG: DNA-processing protein DprA [Bacteroidota bacterium]